VKECVSERKLKERVSNQFRNNTVAKTTCRKCRIDELYLSAMLVCLLMKKR